MAINVNVFHIHTAAEAGEVGMAIADKIDDYGKGAWIGLTILGFWMFWPIGLATLVFLMCTGRTRAWKMEARGRWHNMERSGSADVAAGAAAARAAHPAATPCSMNTRPRR